MTKTIKKLEKEKTTWKTKCENGNRSLLQMVDEVNHFFAGGFVRFCNFSQKKKIVDGLCVREGLQISPPYVL